jgi:DNA polymerase-1
MEEQGYRLVVEREEVVAMVAALRAEPRLGLDTETTGLDPYQSRLRLLQLATPATTWILDCFALSPEDLRPLHELFGEKRGAGPLVIAHNAKFDGKFLAHHLGLRLGRIFDTYLASLLVSAGREHDRHGLEPVVARYLDQSLNKDAQLSDWSGPLTKNQLDYAARDAAILLPLHSILETRLDELDLLVTADLEFEAVMPIAQMELNGVYLDVPAWQTLLAEMRVAHDQLRTTLQQELSAGAHQLSLFGEAEPINLDSPAQVRDALARIGIDLEDTRESRLHPLADAHPILARLLEYRHLSKNLSAYGENILAMIHPVTGRIHPDFRQIGSPTGRITSSSPSLQQIPQTAPYRSCFRAPAGRKLVIADYSQIEMRILADFSRDVALLAAFDQRMDLHRQTAAQMFGLSVDQVTQRQREFAKGLNYGLMYGMGAEGLASRLETSLVEATSLIERYFGAYPAVARWLEDAGRRAVEEGRARTASGRLWIFTHDIADPAQEAALRRVGKNAPIQGTASDLFKRALCLLEDALAGMDARLVNCIHDELVFEVDASIAEEVEHLVAHHMVEAAREFLRRVPVEVDTVVSDSWVRK